MEYFLQLLASFVAVTVVLTVHEFSHAFAAYKCGDDTAKLSGRMSLNPLQHFDPLGLISFAIVGFGWAKPVPINPNNFRSYRKGLLWTASAGVLANYIMAFFFYPLLWLVIEFLLPPLQGLYASFFLYALFSYFYLYSLSFCVFNLLPLYPLDGFRILDVCYRGKGKIYNFIARNGYYILLALIAVRMLAQYLPILGYIDVLGYFMYFAQHILGKPIQLLWNWIFGMIF